MSILDEKAVRSVVEEVLSRLGRESQGGQTVSPVKSAPAKRHASTGRPGVFDNAADAVAAAKDAYRELTRKGVAARSKVVDLVKAICTDKAAEWGRLELDETKIGRLDHKIEKLQIVKFVPGVEFLRPDARSGDFGITLEEYAPVGVVGAITPSTHSIPTLAGNIINIVAGGNAVVFNAHPAASKCAATAVEFFNRAIERETGIRNLVCAIEPPTLESFQELSAHPDVALLLVTGGPGVVAAALKSGKRAICAGPGNPPVLVDDTVCAYRAAEKILTGASYDNNLLCIGEKEVFVLDRVADALLEGLSRAGGHRLSEADFEALARVSFDWKDGVGCAEPVLNRDLVGKDPSVLAQQAGIRVPAKTPLLFGETPADSPFVMEEQMMPVLPIVRVKSVEEGIRLAKQAEHGYRHSAIIHSTNVEHMTAMARELEPTLFVKNGACVAGLGIGGEGYLSYSIATTTGEGISNPKTFTRTRRCVMVEHLKIY